MRNLSIACAAWRPSRIAHTDTRLTAPDIARSKQLVAAFDLVALIVGTGPFASAAEPYRGCGSDGQPTSSRGCTDGSQAAAVSDMQISSTDIFALMGILSR